MNHKTKQLAIRPCVVCGYKFSDRHHVFPQAHGGARSPTIVLCPNHHRYANLIQVCIAQGIAMRDIRRFAAEHFDQPFIDMLLAPLMERAITGTADLNVFGDFL